MLVGGFSEISPQSFSNRILALEVKQAQICITGIKDDQSFIQHGLWKKGYLGLKKDQAVLHRCIRAPEQCQQLFTRGWIGLVLALFSARNRRLINSKHVSQRALLETVCFTV